MVTMEGLRASRQIHVAYKAAAALDYPEAPRLREAMLADPRVSAVISELGQWPGMPLASHRSASQGFHKLVFLADIGVRADDPGMDVVIGKILASLNAEGIPLLPVKPYPGRSAVPAGVEETGNPEKRSDGMTHAWALCDAPGTLYALLKCGVRDARIDRAVKKLAALVEPKGCGCVVSEELGNWRGPGKASDPCPYATLVVMKLLIEASMRIGIDFRSQIEACGSCLLDLWEQSREKHTYIFYMGNDFRKLKLPFVWYDILHVTDVISRPGIFSGDPRLREMVGVISEKRTDSGYVPESVYLPWKDWDFGQKKLVSDWMTFCALRVESRLITSSWY